MMSSNHRKAKTTQTDWSTQAVHGGEQRERAFHALVDPIVQTSNYVFDNSDDLRAFMAARESGEDTRRAEYGRYGNPTRRAVEDRLADLEGAEEALMVSSGMAAVTCTLLSFLKAGDHLIITDDCYRKTREFTRDFLARFGVASSVVPMGDFAALRAAVRPNTRLLISESPTNPYLRVLDLSEWTRIAREHNLLTMIDTTFATPFNLRPIEFGVDLVIHSATKYLGGHNDLLAGVVLGRRELLKQVNDTLKMMGPVSDPQTAFLLLRGMKTLGLRVRHQNQAAQAVAEFLEGHPAVEQVWYPGLASHPDHAVAKKQMNGFGGVISFTVRGDQDLTAAFVDSLRIPFITPSLGGVESLVTQPSIMSYFPYSKEQREAIGIKDNLVRYAVGIEDAEDLIGDLAQALDWVRA